MRLIIRDLKKCFGKQEVLRGIDYTFEEGKIYSIIGRNGAGKTTLFRCINGDEFPESGSFWLEGDDGARRPLQFEDIGLVSASPVLPEFLTGYEFLRFFLQLHKGRDAATEAAMEHYFSLVSLREEDRHKLIKYYSYGMKNKIQLLCALVRDPKVLLLDEPLSSFDIIVSHDIKQQLLRMKQDHIILMSTHILQLATDISDDIVLLRRGVLTDSADHKLYGDAYEAMLIEALSEDDAQTEKADVGHAHA